MRRMLVMQSGTRGVLVVNGCFCGPMEPDGQAFPTGGDAEIYIQLFPFAPGACPLTAAVTLRGGRVARMEPEGCCYMLLWPDGVMQLELRAPGQADAKAQEGGQAAAPDVLRAYLQMVMAGDARADELLARPQAKIELGAYAAVLPLRFAPVRAPQGYALRAGIVRRLADDMAAVDAVLASAAMDAGGRWRITQMMLIPAQEEG